MKEPRLALSMLLAHMLQAISDSLFSSGADLGFFIRKSNAEGVRPSRGVRGHAPPENFEI